MVEIVPRETLLCKSNLPQPQIPNAGIPHSHPLLLMKAGVPSLPLEIGYT